MAHDSADKVLETARKHCEATSARLTTPREDVLRVVAQAHKPISAYDIIAAMPPGTKPPTVYRALAFWEQESFIHRIGSLGLYVACAAGHPHHGAQFLICDKCGRVDERHDCHAPLPFQPSVPGFTVSSWFVELHGLCAECNGQPAPAAGCHAGCSH